MQVPTLQDIFRNTTPAYIPEISSLLGPLPESRAKMQRLVQLQAFKDSKPYLTYTFLIGPENYQQMEPGRLQVIQTLGGGYANLFGPGLIQIQFQGTTGLQPRKVNGFQTDGYQHFQDLLGIIRDMWSSPIKMQNSDFQFYFWNWTDDQYFQVMPLQNSWSQAVPRQMVFYYNISMITLQNLKQPYSSSPGYAIKQWFTVNTTDTVVSIVNGTGG